MEVKLIGPRFSNDSIYRSAALSGSAPSPLIQVSALPREDTTQAWSMSREAGHSRRVTSLQAFRLLAWYLPARSRSLSIVHCAPRLARFPAHRHSQEKAISASDPGSGRLTRSRWPSWHPSPSNHPELRSLG